MTDELRRGLRLRLAGGFGAFDARIRQFAPVRSGVRLVLEGVGDRDRAEEIVGANIAVARKDLRGLGEQVYLDTDLIGAEVVTRAGDVLGRIGEILTTGANDVYVVAAGGGEILIPAVARAVLEVDVHARRIVVEADALEYPEARSQEPKKPPRRRRSSPPDAI